MSTTITVSDVPAAAVELEAGNQSLDQLAAMFKKRAVGAPPPASPPANPSAAQDPVPSAAENTPASIELETPSTPELPSATEPAAEDSPPPTPAPEAEADTEIEDEEQAALQRDANAPDAVEKLQRRVSKLVRQRNDERVLREHTAQQIDKLRTELEKLKGQGQSAPQPAATRNEAFAWHPDIVELNEQVANAEMVIEWSDDNPDGGDIRDNKGNTYTVDASQVRKMKANAVRAQTSAIARKEAHVTALEREDKVARAQYQQEAVGIYPWLKDKATPEYQEAIEVLRDNPAVVQRPDYLMVIGDYIRGRQARLASKKPSAAIRRAATPTPVVTASANVATRVSDPKQKAIQEAEAEFNRTGSAKDYKRVLALKHQARVTA